MMVSALTAEESDEVSGVGRDLGVGVGLGVGVTVGVGVGVAVGVGLGVGDGSPPFVVRRIMPPSPTAMPRQRVAGKRDIVEVCRASACLIRPGSSGIRGVQDSADCDQRQTRWPAVGKATPSIA